MESLSRSIGENIRKYRKIRNMTREQLAEALSIDTAYLGQCERGERQLGLSKTIEVIRFFGVTPNDIIPVNQQRSSSNKDKYLDEIYAALDGCSDNQLLAVLHCITPLLPFLKD